MSNKETSKRGALFHDTVVFQLKLMADGFRDLVLVPVSMIASLIGLLRGGDDPARVFRQVVQVGRESEKWINLFGNHDTADNSNAVASIDALFGKVEETLKQHYKASGTSKTAQAEIDEALHAVQAKTKKRK